MSFSRTVLLHLGEILFGVFAAHEMDSTEGAGGLDAIKCPCPSGQNSVYGMVSSHKVFILTDSGLEDKNILEETNMSFDN